MVFGWFWSFFIPIESQISLTEEDYKVKLDNLTIETRLVNQQFFEGVF